MTGQAHATHGSAIGAIAEVGTFVFNQAPDRRDRSADGMPLGTLLTEVTDPFVLEVHRPITLEGASGLPPLPQYVRRSHDARLAEVVARAAAGESAMAVLVAGSSAGKTRACWEALEPLRSAEDWRLWHPYDPTRSEAAVEALDQVKPRTVVWLNETQEYLGSGDEAERVAAKLRSLLSDSTRAPVLVLGTLWPEHHATLTHHPGSQVRLVLEGTVIEVPETFTGTALVALNQATAVDERLKRAVEHADDGQITQYLAGGPELLERFHAGPPAAKALILAAMDARRLGHRSALPLALLEQAAPAYLTEAQLDQLGEDWLEKALAYASRPCKGARGPIARIRPDRRPRSRTDRRAKPSELLYQLADYLEQYGRTQRSEQIPPVGFWVAAASHAHPDSLGVLADAAWARGLLRDAAQLGKTAIGHGATYSASTLVRRMRIIRPADLRPAEWTVEHIALDKVWGVVLLLKQLLTMEAAEQVGVLLGRDPAHQVGLDSSYGISELLEQLHLAGASTQVARLAERAAHEVVLDSSFGFSRLLERLQAMGTAEQVTTLAGRAVSRVVLENATALTGLFEQLQTVAAADQIAALLARDPARHVALDHPSAIAQLLAQLQGLGAVGQVAALLARDPARHVGLDRPSSVANLLHQLQAVGAADQVRALAARAAAEVALDNSDIAQLLEQLQAVGATDQVAALLARDPASHVTLDGPPGLGNAFGIGRLLRQLRRVGAGDQVVKLAGRVTAEMALDRSFGISHLFDQLQAAGNADQVAELANRAASEMALDNPYAISQLLRQLQTEGFIDQVVTLLARDPASRVALDSSSGIAGLLDQLQATGASDQVVRLADLAASEVALDSPSSIAQLLKQLQTVGADDQAATLASRAAAHIALDGPLGISQLLEQLQAMEASNQIGTMVARDPASHATLDSPSRIAKLLEQLHKADADDQVTVLLARNPGAKVTLNGSFGIIELLKQLHAIGATDQATKFADRAASEIKIDSPHEIAQLLEHFRAIEATDQIAVLLARNPATHTTPERPSTVAPLLRQLDAMGETYQAINLADRAASEAILDDPFGISQLLKQFEIMKATDQITALLARNPATHTSLDSPFGVGQLLEQLLAAGAVDQVVILANRAATDVVLDNANDIAQLLEQLRAAGATDQLALLLARDPAAHIALDNPASIELLLDVLRSLGAIDQVATLTSRIKAKKPIEKSLAISPIAPPIPGIASHAPGDNLFKTGSFERFLTIGDHAVRFRFGREPDGSPADVWSWDDLE